MSYGQLTVYAGGIVCLAVLFRWLWRSDVPPGPKQLPLIGNLHQIPLEYQHKTFAKWGKLYGSVIHARFFQTPVLVLDTLQAARDLLEKRSGKYSGRPRTVLISEMIIPYHDMILLDYGDRWRTHRRWIQNTLSNKASLAAWQIAQQREVSVLLTSLIAEPDQFLKHVRQYSAALIMEIAYGYTVKSADDQYVVTMTEAMEGIAGSGNAGSTLVDFFPVLKYIPTWMPGAGFKRKAIATQHIVRDAVDAPFEWVKKQMKAGIANQSIMSQLIEESEKKGTLAEDELDLRGIGGAIFGAGTDTTFSVLATFALTMVLHPQVLRKAQEEIDRVVGPDRLPEISDRAALPYIESVINEVYRWNVSAPLGIPHCASEDDEFLGYRVAKGTMVIPNIWAMSQKEDIYPDPQEFRPERFMAMGASEMDTADPRNYIFGFGRRICPGRHFADMTIWIAVANLIATMNIREAKDAYSERKSTLSPSFVPGIISHPQPFDCYIEPRSARSEALITQLRVATDG